MGSLDATSFDSVEYRPSVLEGRIGSSENPEVFIGKLRASQDVPCPWGSLAGKSDDEVRRMFFEWSEGIMDFPLALELGCGEGFGGRVCSTCPQIGKAETTLLSDHVRADSPLGVPDNYVQIDLTKPEQIDLGGIRCHWIAENMVLTRDTYDGNSRYGVVWPSREVMQASLDAIQKLLLPNGLFSIYPADGFPVPVDQFAQAHGLDVFWLEWNRVLFQKRF